MSEKHMSSDAPCPVCATTGILAFIDIGQVPVHCNLLWTTRDEAVHAPHGEIRLGFCSNCGYIFNLAFDPALMEYNQNYENSLHYSALFQSYANSLAAHLVDRYDLHHKDIIEIGCGQGEFLKLLCELGDNGGVGFDPSYIADPTAEMRVDRMMFVQDVYSERYASYQADLICCRQVLEHIQAPRDFVVNVRRTIGERRDTAVFFEVPNMLHTLRELAIWDIIYAHCSYFSADSLAYLFSTCGFDVRSLTEAYGGQFLAIEALPRRNEVRAAAWPRDEYEQLAGDVAAFANKYRQRIAHWRCVLDHYARSGRRVVIWGAGAKGVTFLNTLNLRDQIEYAVDVNPRKHGMFIAGTGQQIVPPEVLRDYQPDVVIVMNSLYEHEIQQIAKNLGITIECVCV